MTAALYRFRSEVRRGGWRFILGLSLLGGLVGGVALVSFTGARRTASAFERLETETLATQILVNPDSEAARELLTPDVLAGLDGVESVLSLGGVVATFDGQQTDVAVFQNQGGASYFDDADRPVVREGRLPDQSKDDELFANPAGAAATGLDVGDTVDLVAISAAGLGVFEEPGDPTAEIERMVAAGEFGEPLSATLVGIGVTASDVVPGGELDSLFLTKAFSESRDLVPIFSGSAVRLSGGDAAVDRFAEDVRALLPPDAGVDLQTLDSDRNTVQRAVRPQAIALSIVTLVLGLGAVLTIGQSLGRRALVGLDDEDALSSLGMPASDRRLVDWMRLGAVALTSTAVALVVAILLSPLTPFGLARDVEPTPGLLLDPFALAVGAAVFALCSIAAGVITTLRARQPNERTAGPSRTAAWLRSQGTPPPLSIGVGLALEPGRGRSAVPTRSTLVAATVGIAAVVASLTFSASIDQLVATPADSGSDFDAIVEPGDIDDGQIEAVAAKVFVAMNDDPNVEGWSRVALDQLSLPGGLVPVNAVGFEKGTVAGPTLVDGRFPGRADEIALGVSTMRAESVAIGDTIEIQDRQFDIVGQVVLPGLRRYLASDQAALGIGALLTPDGLGSLRGTDGLEGLSGLLLNLAPGASLADVQSSIDTATGVPGAFEVDSPPVPSDVASLDRIRATPLLLAALLGLLAAASVGQALIVAVRRRQRDLAVVRAMGFTPAQTSRTVAWNATTVSVFAAAVGIPIGLILGRIAWGAVTRQIGIVNRPAIPILAVLLALPLAILLTNLAALIPGLQASRLHPATILRTE